MPHGGTAALPCTSPALFVPVGLEQGNQAVGAPQPAQHWRGRNMNMKCCLHNSGVPETVEKEVRAANGHCSVVMLGVI